MVVFGGGGSRWLSGDDGAMMMKMGGGDRGGEKAWWRWRSAGRDGDGMVAVVGVKIDVVVAGILPEAVGGKSHTCWEKVCRLVRKPVWRETRNAFKEPDIPFGLGRCPEPCWRRCPRPQRGAASPRPQPAHSGLCPLTQRAGPQQGALFYTPTKAETRGVTEG
ncbi:hypothetical protein Tco_1402214 [Tanacetum coccineum]